jgi:2-(1,2-epoxy-1,2-dihydrophenyl)acetyl-CoA isomerase
MAGVLFERVGGVAVITLNEPDTSNALSATIRDGLMQHLEQAESTPEIRCVLLTGTGRTFCGGGDIRGFDDRTPVTVRARLLNSQKLAAYLTGEKPVVMAVNGAAAGAGFGLAMLGDVILVAPEARFIPAFPRIGAVPDLGLAYTLPRAVGLSRAKDILLRNRDVSSTEAMAIGLAHERVEGGRLMEEALAVATALSEGATVALGMSKALMQGSFDMSAKQFFQAEAAAQALAFSSQDFGEGVAAFRAKRRPNFIGR